MRWGWARPSRLCERPFGAFGCLQAISLLLSRPIKGPCLVLCPMAAVQQWVREIEKFTKKGRPVALDSEKEPIGALKTLVYHGSEKGRLAAQFKRCDVVITTYQTLEPLGRATS